MCGLLRTAEGAAGHSAARFRSFVFPVRGPDAEEFVAGAVSYPPHM